LTVELFHFTNDALRSLGIALGISIALTFTIVLFQAEEE
jgi:hypothetical protein